MGGSPARRQIAHVRERVGGTDPAGGLSAPPFGGAGARGDDPSAAGARDAGLRVAPRTRAGDQGPGVGPAIDARAGVEPIAQRRDPAAVEMIDVHPLAAVGSATLHVRDRLREGLVHPAHVRRAEPGALVVALLAELGGRLHDLDVVLAIVQAELRPADALRPVPQIVVAGHGACGRVEAAHRLDPPLGHEQAGVRGLTPVDEGSPGQAEQHRVAVLEDTRGAVSGGVPVVGRGSQQALLDQLAVGRAAAKLVDDRPVVVDGAPAAGGVQQQPGAPARLQAVRMGREHVVRPALSRQRTLVDQATERFDCHGDDDTLRAAAGT